MKKIYPCCITILLILFLSSCPPAEENNKPVDLNPTPTPTPFSETVTDTIGTSGGIIEGTSGTKLEIPAGALSEDTFISFTLYTQNSILPETWCPIPCMFGAVKLEPEGLAFNNPVKLTIASNQKMGAGQEFALLYWDENLNKWDDDIQITATVNEGGLTFSANITHFSGFGGGAIENLVNSGDKDAFKNEFTRWFSEYGRQIGSKKARNEECFEVVGMDFDLVFNINGNKGEEPWRIGRKTDHEDPPLEMVHYEYDAQNGSNTINIFVSITVTIYYDCTEPDFRVSADKTVLKEGEETTVRSQLACAGTPLQRRNMTFDIASGPGEVNPGNTTTNSGGEATTAFTAGDKNAVVRAYHTACEMDQNIVMNRTQAITVAPEKFYMAISFDQTTSTPDYYDAYSYSGTVVIEVSSDNGDGTANVSGTNTFEVTGAGGGGDCTTTITGSVTFTFTGTLLTDNTGKQTLELTETPDFNTIKTIYCPDEPPFPFKFLTGGEPFSYTIPVENNYTIEKTIPAGPITSHMLYILTF